MYKGVSNVAKVSHHVLFIDVPKRTERGKISHKYTSISQNGRKILSLILKKTIRQNE